MAENSQAEPVYYHECQALGKNAIVPRALVANNRYIIFYQHKCVFCNHIAGPREYAKGITPDTMGGYYIDEKIAEKLQ